MVKPIENEYLMEIRIKVTDVGRKKLEEEIEAGRERMRKIIEENRRNKEEGH